MMHGAYNFKNVNRCDKKIAVQSQFVGLARLLNCVKVLGSLIY
jgi:hypothetical protein